MRIQWIVESIPLQTQHFKHHGHFGWGELELTFSLLVGGGGLGGPFLSFCRTDFIGESRWVRGGEAPPLTMPLLGKAGSVALALGWDAACGVVLGFGLGGTPP